MRFLPTARTTMAALHNFMRDMKRILPFLALTLLLTLGDGADVVTYMYALGGLTGIAALTHVIRRVLFPYIDMSVLATRAQKSATGAAIVFASVAVLLASFVLAFSALMS